MFVAIRKAEGTREREEATVASVSLGFTALYRFMIIMTSAASIPTARMVSPGKEVSVSMDTPYVLNGE